MSIEPTDGLLRVVTVVKSEEAHVGLGPNILVITHVWSGPNRWKNL
jgi:hypothetical protein